MSNTAPEVVMPPAGQAEPGLSKREQQMEQAAATTATLSASRRQAAAKAKAEEEKKRKEAEKKKQQRRKQQQAKREQELAQWETTFKQQYPQYAWMFDDLDRTKYGDVFDLFLRKIDPKEGLTDDRFEEEFKGTSWYREIQASNKVADINAEIGTLDWDPGTLSKFVNTAIGMGWKDEQLKQEAFKQVFAKNPVGEYLNPNAVKAVRQTANYLRYQNTAKQYFMQLGEDKIEKALTGQLTDDDVVNSLRVAAKMKYQHLAEAIDAGQTLEDLTSDYKKVAAQLLEKPEESIDMSTPDFETAIAFDDGKGKRMLTTGEWSRLLKTDKKYGWESTQQAVDLGRRIGMNIVQSFQRGF